MTSDLSILAEVLVISSLIILSLGYFFSSKVHIIFGKKFPVKIGHNLNNNRLVTSRFFLVDTSRALHFN